MTTHEPDDHDVQRLPVAARPVGGTFRLTVQGRTSEAIPFDASPELVDRIYRQLIAPEPTEHA